MLLCLLKIDFDRYNQDTIRTLILISSKPTHHLSGGCIRGSDRKTLILFSVILLIVFIFAFLDIGAYKIMFCTLKSGWGWDQFIEETNTGKGLKIPGWISPYARYLLPLIVLTIFVQGWLNVLDNKYVTTGTMKFPMCLMYERKNPISETCLNVHCYVPEKTELMLRAVHPWF